MGRISGQNDYIMGINSWLCIAVCKILAPKGTDTNGLFFQGTPDIIITMRKMWRHTHEYDHKEKQEEEEKKNKTEEGDDLPSSQEIAPMYILFFSVR